MENTLLTIGVIYAFGFGFFSALYFFFLEPNKFKFIDVLTVLFWPFAVLMSIFRGLYYMAKR